MAKLHMKMGRLYVAEEKLFQTLQSKELTIDMGLAVCRSAVECKWYSYLVPFQFFSFDIALKGYDFLIKRFANSPHLCKVNLLKFELLMSPGIQISGSLIFLRNK
jgi:hypothetical protein